MQGVSEKRRINRLSQRLKAFVDPNTNTFTSLPTYTMPKFQRGMNLDIDALEQLFLGDIPYDENAEALVRYK